MNKRSLISRILLIIGSICMLLGAIDPLEGSVIILFGIILVTIGIFLKNPPRRETRFWSLTFALILFGVAAMFVLSAFGGFGGDSAISWWWAILILPYPIGWLLGIGGLIARVIKYFKSNPKTA